MLTNGLKTFDRNAVQLCDTLADPTLADPTEEPALADPAVEPAAEDPVDSCDELERELVANQTVVPTNFAREFRLQRRVHEPAGFHLFKNSVEVPILIAQPPKQNLSVDEVVEVLVARYRRKHDAAGHVSFRTCMPKIAGCYRELADEGQLALKDRMSRILPVLTGAYKKLFDRKAASICGELKAEIARIVLNSKCKLCGGSFVPSDQSLYGSDADGQEVVVGKKSYNTRDFCESRCEAAPVHVRAASDDGLPGGG